MDYKLCRHEPVIAPRLIIHGGAGNLTPSNLPPLKYQEFHDSLLRVLSNTHHFLTSPSSFPLEAASSTSALDAVTFAVTQLEDCPLFNAGHGAVFTRDGRNELEASIMVSKGKKKRGVGLMGLEHVKNPIKLAREMLLHGETDLEGGNGEHRAKAAKSNTLGLPSGAQGHCQLHTRSAEELARTWGLEMVNPSYYFTQHRWDEHMRGLENEKLHGGVATWSAEEFFPQGTVGAVALDSNGVVACATSTGGMTNKLTDRIGDTPSLGAGFWAEEWEDVYPSEPETILRRQGPVMLLSDTLKGFLSDCFPSLTLYSPLPSHDIKPKSITVTRSTAISGTGNGDSFLRTNAARTASAIARYSKSGSPTKTSLQQAITAVSGPHGELQQSAGDRWRRTGEGEGGMIGIEYTEVRNMNGIRIRSVSHVISDFNCSGMFTAVVDENGKAIFRVWKDGQWDGLAGYEGEGKEYDVRGWRDEEVVG